MGFKSHEALSDQKNDIFNSWYVITSHALTIEGMEVLGRLKVTGNSECMVCGFSETCPMSSQLTWIFGDDTKVILCLHAIGPTP